MLRETLNTLATVILATLLYSNGMAMQWLNETNQLVEADFAKVQFPSTLTVGVSQQSDFAYGRLSESGVTELDGPAGNILADLGYGPSGSDPRSAAGWTWFPAAYSVQTGNDDEYKATLTAPAVAGTYSYAYRFSLDNGSTWTAADLDGAGSNPELAFSTSQLGVLTVTGTVSNDVDFAVLQFPAMLNLQASQPSGSIYGRMSEKTVTALPGEPDNVVANVGYGPVGSDPRSSAAWTWSAANYNAQIGNDDEFFGNFTTPAVNGLYAFTYRFSLNGGSTWTVADLDGAGANDGLAFNVNLLGSMTVTGGINSTVNPADFNNDGQVTGLDLVVWKSAFGKGGGADVDQDGDTDGADFLRWQRAVGATSTTAGAVQAPEPAGAALCGMCCAALVSRAKSRRFHRARSSLV